MLFIFLTNKVVSIHLTSLVWVVSQEDSAPAHTAWLTQTWIAANSLEFISKDGCPQT